MWLFSSLVFLANPLLGAVLLISAAVTTGLKVATVDRELARHGKPPASYGLIQGWLDRRKAAGKAPGGAKVKPYGSWAYAKQRWLAMWEDLGERHQQVRADYKQACADARRDGRPVPKKPTFKQSLTGWQWTIDEPQPEAPDEEVKAKPSDPASTAPARDVDGRDARRAEADRLTKMIDDAQPGWPTSGACNKCGKTTALTIFGCCEPCLNTTGTAMCAGCHDPMVRDGDVYRHSPHQSCDAVAPIANRTPAPGNGPVTAPHNEGDSMTAAQQSGEVTGIPSAIGFLDAMATVHRQHADNEHLITAMANLGVGAGDLNLTTAAMTKSAEAADLYDTAAKELDATNRGVREGYGSAPDAADKRAHLTE
jgi:hypothetical protein